MLPKPITYGGSLLVGAVSPPASPHQQTPMRTHPAPSLFFTIKLCLFPICLWVSEKHNDGVWLPCYSKLQRNSLCLFSFGWPSFTSTNLCSGLLKLWGSNEEDRDFLLEEGLRGKRGLSNSRHHLLNTSEVTWNHPSSEPSQAQAHLQQHEWSQEEQQKGRPAEQRQHCWPMGREQSCFCQVTKSGPCLLCSHR